MEKNRYVYIKKSIEVKEGVSQAIAVNSFKLIPKSRLYNTPCNERV